MPVDPALASRSYTDCLALGRDGKGRPHVPSQGTDKGHQGTKDIKGRTHRKSPPQGTPSVCMSLPNSYTRAKN
jgi:hypothetical protein